MKFSLKHIYKYLTSRQYRSGELVQTSDDELNFKPNKYWAKIEKGGVGELQWTDYTDHDGTVSRIYDLIPDSGFSGGLFKKI